MPARVRIILEGRNILRSLSMKQDVITGYKYRGQRCELVIHGRKKKKK